MTPYRSKAIVLGDRWNVTGWKKLFVRVVRKFYNLRSKYQYRREYNRYLLALKRWHEADKQYYTDVFVTGERRRGCSPPMPLPPPVPISE